jgi:hypothetical protein
MINNKPEPPVPVKILAVLLFLFGQFAFLGSLFLWGQGFLFSFPEGVDLRFPMADLFVNAPASFIAALGLWGMRDFGYAAAYFVAGFYIYASVEIFVELFQSGPPFALEILIPQVMAVATAAALVLYLWRIRAYFNR